MQVPCTEWSIRALVGAIVTHWPEKNFPNRAETCHKPSMTPPPRAGLDVARPVRSALPKKLQNLTFPSTPLPLSRALAERGYDEPTPVQPPSSDANAADRDLIVSAQTGSGKTIAYGLALADTLLRGADTMPPEGRWPLIIAPTRELALQVQRELEWLYANTGAAIVACVGGMDPARRAPGAGARRPTSSSARRDGCATMSNGVP